MAEPRVPPELLDPVVAYSSAAGHSVWLGGAW